MRDGEYSQRSEAAEQDQNPRRQSLLTKISRYYILNGGPSQKGVVTNERRNIAVGNREPDRCVHEISEESNRLLEPGIGHIHYAGRELDDRNLW
jgi:hypothetical protein